MSITPEGWCAAATQLPSPNFNHRPPETAITLLVIHNISLPFAEFGHDYVADLFLNRLDLQAHPSFESLRDLKVSTHFYIQRDGGLQQFVSTLDRAWHAGISHFQGRDGCNDFSIGIELEGTDEQPFEDAQYQQLQQLTQLLLQYFPIQHIVGHQDIAPGRKTDPGPHFDWKYYQKLLSENIQKRPKLVSTIALPSFPFVL